MRITTTGMAALLLIAGCGSTTTITIPPAGYADGTKDLLTPDLSFDLVSTGIEASGPTSGSPTSISNASETLRLKTNTDPTKLSITIGGIEYTLDQAPGGGSFGFSDGATFISLGGLDQTIDDQVALLFFQQQTITGANADFKIYVALAGLETDPAEVSALGGTATFNGNVEYISYHDEIATSGNIENTDGSGTVALTANFSTSSVAGSMFLTDNGNVPGYQIPAIGTTIQIDPAQISGNGFSSTLSMTPGDLAMTSVTTSAINGKFYGPDAANVGATFSGSGISTAGGVPVVFYGGFVATK